MNHVRAVTVVAVVLLLAAACGGTARPGSPRGTVTGTLVLTGGPVPPGGSQPESRPIDGTIEFRRTGRQPVKVHAGRSGTFSASLPAGTYQAIARSPHVVEVSGGTVRQPPCSKSQQVKVTAGHRTTIALACIVP